MPNSCQEILQDPAPRLVKSSIKWYIEYYVIKDDQPVRIRKTFKLNQIRSIKERLNKANDIILDLINGNSYNAIKLQKDPSDNIIEAVSSILKIKYTAERENSRKNFRTIELVFIPWLNASGLDKLTIDKFTIKHCYNFVDYLLVTRGIKNVTYNNYLYSLKTIWAELLKRKLITHNPWIELKKKKPTQKNRISIATSDKSKIIELVKTRSEALYYAILLSYYCFIRPSEIRRLRVGMFDLDEGLIRMPGSITKNRRSEVVTIPQAILPAFDFLINANKSYYLIGNKMELLSPMQISRDCLSKNHRKILIELYKSNLLDDLTGLSLYSWKDTGVLNLINKGIDMLTIMKQLRHSDLSVTQKYCTSISDVSKDIRSMSADVL